MKIVIAPGYSTRNQELVRKCIEAYENHEVVGLRWNHWSLQIDDLRSDIEKLVNEIDSNTTLIAKSYGVGVSLHALQRASPRKAIFMGTPIQDGQDFPSIPTGYSVVFIQNFDDPFGSFEELSNHVPASCQVIMCPGATHDYDPPSLELVLSD